MDNRVVWITGASTGIGEAIAYIYAKNGARLILSARSHDKLLIVGKECELLGGTVRTLPIDLLDSGEIPVKVEKAIEFWGQVDLIIHSAGVSQRSLGSETSYSVDQQMMQLNYLSVVKITKALFPNFKKQHGGSVIVMSSLSGLMGYPQRSAYAASKFALHGFFETLQTEREMENVNFLLVCPGRVKTNISLHALKGDGTPHGKMDIGQQKGIDPKRLALKVWKAEKNKKKRIIVAQEEWILLILHRICRPLFFWLAYKTGR